MGFRKRSKCSGVYRSKFEESFASTLKEHKVEFTYEEYILTYDSAVTAASCHTCGSKEVFSRRTYTPDFYIYTDSGGIFIETKGKWTGRDRTKMLDIVAQFPDERFIMVFQRDNYLDNKTKKTRYSEWCDRHGIEWYIKELPDSWFEENL